jgi:hypothetical protein
MADAVLRGSAGAIDIEHRIIASRFGKERRNIAPLLARLGVESGPREM